MRLRVQLVLPARRQVGVERCVLTRLEARPTTMDKEWRDVEMSNGIRLVVNHFIEELSN